jgi:hypothetical protein
LQSVSELVLSGFAASCLTQVYVSPRTAAA